MAYDEHQNAQAAGLTRGGLNQRYAGETIRQESTLERLICHLNALQQAASEIGVKLRDHADILHGEQPTEPTGGKPAAVRCGQIGALEDAIDRLDDTLSFVSVQATRNCTLA